MKGLALSLVALGLTAGAFAQTFSTGFEPSPTEAANWQLYTTGNTAAYSSAGMTNYNGTLNSNYRVQNTSVISGAQSMEITNSATGATNSTDYYLGSGNGLTGGFKRVFARTLFQPTSNALSSTNVRGFGLTLNSGTWRLYVHPTGTANQYAIGFTNGITFGSADITGSTFTSTTYLNNPHYLSLALDIATPGTGTGSAIVNFDGSSYTVSLNPSVSTSAITTISLLNRATTTSGASGSSSAGSARFDNFAYSVPEPSGIAILAGACTTLFLRRRRA